jgi:hypothetical protein
MVEEEANGEMPFPAFESAPRPPHSSGDTPQRPDALRAFSSSRLAAAFSSLPGGQGRCAPSAPARFPFVGTADRPLLRARPRLTSPGARERPLPERNKHSFPSAGVEGAALLVMQIGSTVQEPPYRTGTLTGLTLAEIQQRLTDIPPDTRPSAGRKVTTTWRFLGNGQPCGIWDYRKSYDLRGELSTFGPDEVFTALFGHAYTGL